jgi:hypothetical protein
MPTHQPRQMRHHRAAFADDDPHASTTR